MFGIYLQRRHGDKCSGLVMRPNVLMLLDLLLVFGFVAKFVGLIIQLLWSPTLGRILTLLGTAHTMVDNNVFGRITSLKLLRGPTRPRQRVFCDIFFAGARFRRLVGVFSGRGGT